MSVHFTAEGTPSVVPSVDGAEVFERAMTLAKSRLAADAPFHLVLQVAVSICVQEALSQALYRMQTVGGPDHQSGAPAAEVMSVCAGVGTGMGLQLGSMGVPAQFLAFAKAAVEAAATDSFEACHTGLIGRPES